MNKTPIILGIGEIVWDCLPGGRKLGGAPVNFAYHAMQLGAESYPVSAVGADLLGDETLRSCRSYGLDTRFIQVNRLPTSRVLVTLDEAGVPSYEIVENVAWDAFEATSDSLALASKADAVCWGSLAQRSPVSADAVRKILSVVPGNALRVFDINLRQHYYSREVVEKSLELASVLKLNEDELPVVLSLVDAADITSLMSRYSLDYVIYTAGAAYSEIYSPAGLLSHLETPRVEVADTVGAGDSFTAAFVTSLLQGQTPAQAHVKAVSLSAWLCTVPGAINPHSL